MLATDEASTTDTLEAGEAGVNFRARLDARKLMARRLLCSAPTDWRWCALGLSFALSASFAFAVECPVTLVGGQPALQHLNAETRLHFLRERLHTDAHNARVWSYSWGAIYSSLAIGQFIAAPLVSPASRPDFYVGAGASLIGLAPLLFTPLNVMQDEEGLVESNAAAPGADPCVSLAWAEGRLVRDAANEAEGRSLLFHGGNIVINTGIFFIIGSGFGHWTSATISLLTGVATGEIMIFTQPVGALNALHSYRKGDVVSPTPVFRVAVVPLVTRNASGVVLALLF